MTALIEKKKPIADDGRHLSGALKHTLQSQWKCTPKNGAYTFTPVEFVERKRKNRRRNGTRTNATKQLWSRLTASE